jgi:hypothetical protein
MNHLVFRGLITAFLLVVLLCMPSIASADGITWTLSDVTFDDGGVASGSFVYDALTNTYSSIDMTTTSGSAFAGTTYNALSGLFGSTSTGMLLGASGDLTDTDVLLLLFSAPLTDSGGTVVLFSVLEGTCDNTDCSVSTLDRSTSGGELVGTVTTPEPSTLSLLAVALVALMAVAAIRKSSYA